MGTGLHGDPNTYPAGTDFDYSVWTPGTRVDLVNVPWNNDYRDVVRFDSKEGLNAYINNFGPASLTINNLTYAKPGQDIYLSIPNNRANRYNYLRASNPLMPIPGDERKDYYYFILDTEYVSPETTRLRLQLDVWQTYVYDLEFGNCYVERGHIGIANQNAFNNYGRDYLAVPEGFDLGGEYRTLVTRSQRVLTLTPTIDDDNGEFMRQFPSHDILVVSSTDLLADPGTVDDPNLVSAKGGTFQGTRQGASFYVFDTDSFFSFMNTMQQYPWVTQGIMSITIIPKLTRYYPNFTYAEGIPTEITALLYPKTNLMDMYPNWRNHESIVNSIPQRYRHLLKLKTYPYMAVELTTFSATPIVLKPEVWNSPDARIFERASLVPPAQRMEFGPRYYNSRIDNENDAQALYPGYAFPAYADIKGDDEGDYIDLVTQIANFPTMSIVNNGQINYLASNTHGLAFSRQSADWSQSRALGMASGNYDIATGALHTAQDLQGSAMNADIAQTANTNRTIAAQSIANVAGNTVGGAAFGPQGALAGAASGVANLVSTGIQTAANDEALGIRNTASVESLMSNDRQGRLVRDTNKSLADWAARGDYANQIAGINAKVQDAALIQPTTSGQIGGESINMVNGGWMVSLRFKMIDNANIRIIGEYWLRYGYAIRAFIRLPQTLKVMNKFTYWKLSETYIIAATVPEAHKQVVRGILEKGVTVWSNPSDIGRIDLADNKPLEGISY